MGPLETNEMDLWGCRCAIDKIILLCYGATEDLLKNILLLKECLESYYGAGYWRFKERQSCFSQRIRS